jgi:Fe-S-cluster containining protein
MKDATPFEIEFRCPQLKINEEGHKLCSIYENRPQVCSNYNCFEASNRGKRRPQNFARISEIIKEVHGVEVKYENPLVSNYFVDKQLELIGVKEIK